MEGKNIDIFKLKIIGLITNILLNLSLSGIIKNNYIKIPMAIIGAMSLTIFAFIITESFKKTSNLSKYMLRVLFIAVVSAYPYLWVYGKTEFSPEDFFNSALTVFICIGSLSVIDKLKTKSSKIAGIIFISIVSVILKFEWAPYFIILTFIIFLYKDNFKLMSFYIISIYTVIFTVSMYFLFAVNNYSDTNELILNIIQIGCILPLPLIKKYNGNLGRSFKWPLYFYYPVMLLTLFFIKKLLV